MNPEIKYFILANFDSSFKIYSTNSLKIYTQAHNNWLIEKQKLIEFPENYCSII